MAGNHARSYFEMAPASIVIRLSDRLAAGYGLYDFQPDGSLPEVVGGIIAKDYPGGEFILGGDVVREVLGKETQKALKDLGVALYRTADRALDTLVARVTGTGFLPPSDGG